MPDLGLNQIAPRLPHGESPKAIFKLLPRPRPMGESPKSFLKRMSALRQQQQAAAAAQQPPPAPGGLPEH